MNEVIQAMLNRRSIREYQTEQIKEEELQLILEAGLSAPSANNSQPWHVTVIQDQEILTWIVEQNKEVMRTSENPEVVKRANDPANHNFYHAPTVVILSAEMSKSYGKPDCANVVTQLAIAAHSLEIGSCYIASFLQAFANNEAKMNELKQKLSLPEGYQPAFSLALGYVKGTYPEAKPRKQNSITYLR